MNIKVTQQQDAIEPLSGNDVLMQKSVYYLAEVGSIRSVS